MGDSTERDRFVDLLRGASIVVVVLGHWLMAAVVRRDGVLRGDNVLVHAQGLQPLTWLFQVMPIFFVAGGYATARALSKPGARSAGYWAGRVLRVVPSALVMASVVTAALALAALALSGRRPAADATLVDVGAITAQPMWFLAVYLLMALVAPLQLRLHARHRWLVLAGAPVAVALLDAARLTGWMPQLAVVNYLLVFAFAQELGFGYQRAAPRWRPSRWAALAVAATGALALATIAGPYAVSMVGLPGGSSSNMAPPTLCVILLTVGQFSLLMAGRARLVRWLERPRVWRATVASNLVALSVFLWHLVALVAALGVLTLLGVAWPRPGSATWWAAKPLVVATACVVLGLLVAAARPLERHTAAARVPALSTTRAAVATSSSALGLAALAAWGFAMPFEVSGSGLVGLHGPPALGLALVVTGWWLARHGRPAMVSGGGLEPPRPLKGTSTSS